MKASLEQLDSDIKKSHVIIIFLCIVISIFKFLPAIEDAQQYISKENFENFGLSCDFLLSERPWYGKINYWFFTWIILIPTLIFSVSPNASALRHGGTIIFSAFICYVIFNLSIDLGWDIRNAPFIEHSYPINSETGYRIDCVNIGDGFSIVFGVMFGWVPALIYTVICRRFWRFYHVKFTKEIKEDSKLDITSRIFNIVFQICCAFLLVTLLLIAARFLSIKLPDSMLFSVLYHLVLRPLLIPFEIFVY